jgi:hypothetical protein
MSSFRTALKCLFRKSGKQTCTAARSRDRASRRVRLGLEHLEDRLTPAQLAVTSALDPATLTPGTLRYAVTQANHDASLGISDTINFNTTQMGTNQIKLQQGPLTLTPGTGTTTINGGGVVTLDGNHASRLFLVDSGASADLTGLTIQNGQAANYGGGIENFGKLTVSSSTLSSNSAEYGGAIFNDGALTLNNNTNVSNNYAWYGGGLYTQGNTAISAATFKGNTASVDGGAIGETAALTVTNSNFYLNKAAQYGGAIFNEATGTLTVSNSSIGAANLGNSAQYGGGIFNDGNLTVNNYTSVFGNSAQYGGGLYTQGNTTISTSTFEKNSASVDGGAIGETAALKITSSNFYLNSAVTYGGAIFNEATGTLFVSGSDIGYPNLGNSAQYGGGIFNYSSLGNVNNGTYGLTVYDDTISANNAQYGGGIFNVGTAKVDSSSISGNTGTNHSGALANTNWLTIRNSTIRNNGSASDGPGIWNESGTLYVNNGTNTMLGGLLPGYFHGSGTTICENTANGPLLVYNGTQHVMQMMRTTNGVVTLFSGGGVYLSPDGTNIGGGGNTVRIALGVQSIAVDGQWNLFALFNDTTIREYTGSGSTWTPVTSTGFTDLVNDATGNVFALGYGNGTVWEHVLGTGFDWTAISSTGCTDLVSDATGNVFVLGSGIVWEHVPGAGSTWNPISSTGCTDLVSDASGNVFVLGSGIVWEHVLGAGSAWTPISSSGFIDLYNDASGNVFAYSASDHLWEHVLGTGWDWNLIF